MIENETKMKMRGENRVWNVIRTRQGGLKKLSSIQLGQQLIFNDALEILSDVRDWVETGSATLYRKDLRDYFTDDEILLQKITEIFLLLAGSSFIADTYLTMSKKTVTRHKRISLIRNKLMPELSFDLVWRLVEVIVDLSSNFEVEKNMTYKNDRATWNMKYICNLNEIITDKLTLEASSAFFPQPMLVKPVDWKYENGEIFGGYVDFQFDMIRAREKVDYKKYSQNIFDAVNFIQSVPWKINLDLVNQIMIDLKIPEKSDYIKTTYPKEIGTEWSIDLTDKNLKLSKRITNKILIARLIFREKAELYRAEAGDYESAVGKYRAVKLALGIAEQYLGENRIYFPHSYDFRGRVYPLPVGLSPQGSDAVKAMLEYAEGEELTKSGEQWSWAYMASLYGDDKIPFEDRVVRGKELLYEDYKNADEPYQFLAHQLEMRKFAKDKSHKVKARVHLDACNSGSQFTSVITGDRAGCVATNVIPTVLEDGSQIRLDAYELVAKRSLEHTESMCKASTDKSHTNVLKLFKSLLEASGRKICKTPVMVSNYGGTSGGRSEIIWNMLRELQVARKWITKKNAALYSKIIGKSITGVLNGGKAFEIYIQKMSSIISRKNKPVTWTTADGFYVSHMKQKELKRKQVKCMLPGSRRATTINKKAFSDQLSSAKMRSAISPNYIHSLDAELLRRTALELKENGLEYTDWIHDSFGSHPNYVSLMLDVTRNEFLQLAKREPLKTLDKQLREQADRTKATQRMLEEIKMPQLGGFDIEAGDLDVILKSDWAYS